MAKRVACRGIPATAADNREWLPRTREAVTNLRNLRCSGKNLDGLDTRAIVDLRGAGKHVLGQCQHYGPRSALSRDPERPCDIFRNALGAIDLRHPFDDASIHAPIIDFLKSLAIA